MVRQYAEDDRAEWLRMRLSLWPDSTKADAVAWMSRADAATFVGASVNGSGLAGFLEVGMRAYADGCDTSPVAFLEGWYVDPEARRTGVGASLLAAAEGWVRERGLQELASDSELENARAYAAHLAVGFEEVERCIRYRKDLRGGDKGVMAASL